MTRPTRPAPPGSNPLERLGPTVESLGLSRKAFPLPPGNPITAVVIRELSGLDDEEIARQVVLAPEASMYYASKLLRKEALRRAIVAYWVPGETEAITAQQPFEQLDRWPLRVQQLLANLFDVVNGSDDGDEKKAAKAASEWQPGDGPPSWPAAAASGASTGSEQPRSA